MDRAELEARLAMLNKLLVEVYNTLTVANGKLDELETEYDLTQDHVGKLKENIAYLCNEAPVVKLKEYKIATEAYDYNLGALQATSAQLETVRKDCSRGLRQAEGFIKEIKTINIALAEEARIYQFPHDK